MRNWTKRWTRTTTTTSTTTQVIPWSLADGCRQKIIANDSSTQAHERQVSWWGASKVALNNLVLTSWILVNLLSFGFMQLLHWTHPWAATGLTNSKMGPISTFYQDAQGLRNCQNLKMEFCGSGCLFHGVELCCVVLCWVGIGLLTGPGWWRWCSSSVCEALIFHKQKKA